MTLFLEDRGWVVDLVERPVESNTRPYERGLSETRAGRKVRGVALSMIFEGDAHVPEIAGEERMPGHHNYFLRKGEGRWRTGVPLYASVRYENLYPGIDLRLRDANGVPEYDVLVEPGADLSWVTVHVEGAQDGDGNKRRLACNFHSSGVDPMVRPGMRRWEVQDDAPH